MVVKPIEAPTGGVFTRPGLYLALLGAAAVGVGIVFGQSAVKVKGLLAAGGDPVGVTRADAKAAPTSALLANVLVAAGGAAVVGGVTWVVLTPGPGAPPPAPKPTGTGEPTEAITPGPSGAMINFGGTF